LLNRGEAIVRAGEEVARDALVLHITQGGYCHGSDRAALTRLSQQTFAPRKVLIFERSARVAEFLIFEHKRYRTAIHPHVVMSFAK
jgi:hypothetical protein